MSDLPAVGYSGSCRSRAAAVRRAGVARDEPHQRAVADRVHRLQRLGRRPARPARARYRRPLPRSRRRPSSRPPVSTPRSSSASPASSNTTTWSARCAGLARVGAEASALTHAAWTSLAAEIDIVPSDGHVEAERRVKDAGEIARIAHAARIADAALAAVAPTLGDEPTEVDVRDELEHTMRRLGADGPSYDTIVASGPDNAARPHHAPGTRRIVEGDTVVIDVGALVDGYHSDMTRSYVVGDPIRRATGDLRPRPRGPARRVGSRQRGRRRPRRRRGVPRHLRRCRPSRLVPARHRPRRRVAHPRGSVPQPHIDPGIAGSGTW